MIPLLDRYHLAVPASLGDALDDLARDPSARPFAGGTDLMVTLEAGTLPPGRFVSLQHCTELNGIEELPSGAVSIGALTTYTEIQGSSRLEREFPLLGMAARETGGVATQNRGTIGGNIANGSPAADTPPVLIVYDAQVELLSASGARRVSYDAFHRGYKKMDLAPGEIIARVILPPRASWRVPDAAGRGSYFRKVGPRRAQAISKVCLAAVIRMGGRTVEDVRIALGSVAPAVVRAVATERALRGQPLNPDTVAAAVRALDAEIAPIDDIRSTARYRRRVAGNLLAEFLTRETQK